MDEQRVTLMFQELSGKQTKPTHNIFGVGGYLIEHIDLLSKVLDTN